MHWLWKPCSWFRGPRTCFVGEWQKQWPALSLSVTRSIGQSASGSIAPSPTPPAPGAVLAALWGVTFADLAMQTTRTSKPISPAARTAASSVLNRRADFRQVRWSPGCPAVVARHDLRQLPMVSRQLEKAELGYFARHRARGRTPLSCLRASPGRDTDAPVHRTGGCSSPSSPLRGMAIAQGRTRAKKRGSLLSGAHS